MAITINKDIFEISPAYNRNEVVLDSTNKSNELFRYLTKITITHPAEVSGEIGIITTPPRPIDGRGRVEVNNIIKEYLQYTGPKFINLFQPFDLDVNHFVNYELEFGERYKYTWPTTEVINTGGQATLFNDTLDHVYQLNDLIFIDSPDEDVVKSGFWRVIDVPATGTIVINQPFQQAQVIVVDTEFADKRTIDIFNLEDTEGSIFNGAIPFNELSNYNDDYNLNNGDQFITMMNDIPTDIYFPVRIDDYITANFWFDDNSNSSQFLIERDNPFIVEEILNTTDDFGTIGLGPANINQILSPADQLQVGDKYFVYCINGQSNPSRIYRFEIVENCTKFENRKIIWLDRLGGWKSFNFDLHSIETLNVENRVKFKREEIGTYTFGDASINYDITLHQDRTEEIEFDKQYNVNCDRLTQEQIIYLEDLFTSRFVYVLIHFDFYPIDILDNNYEIADLLYRRRKTLSLNYKISQKTFNN